MIAWVRGRHRPSGPLTPNDGKLPRHIDKGLCRFGAGRHDTRVLKSRIRQARSSFCKAPVGFILEDVSARKRDFFDLFAGGRDAFARFVSDMLTDLLIT